MSDERLTAYVITWEANRGNGAYYSGARRVLAENAEKARERGRQEVAYDLGLAQDAITILDVRRM